MHVLITGGAGFVGANLTAEMARQGGFKVTVYDNECHGNRSDIDAPIHEFIHGDILDQEKLTQSLEGVDAVIHLAGSTRVIESIIDPWPTFEANAIGTFRLLSACRTAGVNKVVCASTGGAIIGEANGEVDELSFPNPIAPYGASKLAAEGYCSAFSGSYGVKTTSLRFANVFGPRSFRKASVVAAFYRQIIQGKPITVYGDGGSIRDYVFVEDIAKGIIKGVQSEHTGVFQLGSGVPRSVNDLINAMREVVGSDYPVEVIYKDHRDGEIAAIWCNISKAERDLGFASATPFMEGLSATWQWFLDNEELVRKT